MGERNTLHAEIYERGKILMIFLSSRTTSGAFILNENAPVLLSQTVASSLNLTYYWVFHNLLASSNHELITIPLNLTEKSIRSNSRWLQLLYQACIISDVPPSQSFYWVDDCHLAEVGTQHRFNWPQADPSKKRTILNYQTEPGRLGFTSWPAVYTGGNINVFSD